MMPTPITRTPTTRTPITLTDPQIAFYRENGFLAIEAITTSEEISRLCTVYDRLFEQQAGRKDGNQFDLAGTDEEGKPATLPQILGPRNYAPELIGTLYEANALSIAAQLLGAGAVFTGDHAIFKPAASGAATPWHQDEAYWDPGLDYQTLSVWMPLQEATLENGCMVFLPGSHRQEIVPHQSIGGDRRVHGLEMLDAVDESRAVACPLPAGGATFHDARTMHFTGANRSAVPRRAYILGFGLPATLRAEDRHFPWNAAKQTAREARQKAAAGQ